MGSSETKCRKLNKRSNSLNNSLEDKAGKLFLATKQAAMQTHRVIGNQTMVPWPMVSRFMGTTRVFLRQSQRLRFPTIKDQREVLNTITKAKTHLHRAIEVLTTTPK